MILAFSTSTDRGSVALVESPNVSGHVQWQRTPNGAPMTGDVLLPKIIQLMKKAKITQSDLKAVAVDRGPGSFTGSRIAVNVAKTMAYTLGIPVLPFSSLEIMAGEIAAGTTKKKIFEGMKILSLLDAHRSLAYAQLFEVAGGGREQNKNAPPGRFHAMPLTRATAEPLSRILEIIGHAGKDTILVRGLLPKDFRRTFDEIGVIVDEAAPSAKALALLAAWIFSTSPKGESWRSVEPAYIRAPDAVEKLQQK